ncbi:MAG TPA: glucuronyl hydrolase [Mariniphaga anaerophila]|uniref:Glucuronyl hydrolase n=1 Tax=Mariniphaga anaerophila TaxID=1484053 RepID=A0A831LJ54_9BACT|nr:glucuronyl hydrolase [Mariniphaga anaerophila]
MRNLIYFFALFLIVISCKKTDPMQEVISKSFDVIEQQAVAMAEYLDDKEGRLPRSFVEEKDEIITSDSKWWCSGFFPGVLWYLYEYSGDEGHRTWAEKYSARVEKEKYNTYDHDIGFQIYCSFGNGYRLTGRDDYREVLKVAGRSALERYNPRLGVIKSWDFNRQKWQYPVIIDNMMNLELLMWNLHNTGDEVFQDVAVSHSDKTLEHHFRTDNSSYHVVSYDTITGLPHVKQTHQGAFDESIWARGNAWGLYGYVVMYRETKLQRYLDQAIAIANLLIDHPNMPEDGIPYWDYLAPEIPDALRDASAGTIMASALIELSTMTKGDLSQKYLSMAEKQLTTLASPEYLAEPGTNGFFVLKRSVGHLPGNSEVDVPLTYADYYFVEALLRYKTLKGW